MKAYQIQDYYIAAANEPQAIGTLAAHLEEDPKEWGPTFACREVDPAAVPIHFEKDDGSYEPGTLAEIMPSTDDPEVLIDPDYP